jgi:hypothetical protein
VKNTNQIATQSSKNVGEGGSSSGQRKTVSLPIFSAPQPIVAPTEDALICQSCPIPYRMNEALDIVNNTALALLRSFHEESSIWKKARPLTAYVIMGMPGWKTAVRSSLYFRTRNLRAAVRTFTHGMFHGTSRAR